MDKKNLMPHQAHPISRITTGQLPPELAELSEETLCTYGEGNIVPSSSAGLLCFRIVICNALGFFGAAGGGFNNANLGTCAYGGDDPE